MNESITKHDLFSAAAAIAYAVEFGSDQLLDDEREGIALDYKTALEAMGWWYDLIKTFADTYHEKTTP